MSDDVLPAHIAQYIAAQTTPVVEFFWQGGDLFQGPDGYLF